MTYKLMVKQHNITGMKYLCITKRENYEKYLGSGKQWKKHIKEYGNDISTILIEETDDIEELGKLGEYYSKLFNVVNSKCFANVIEERGYVYPNNNPFLLMDEKTRKDAYKRRGESIKRTYDNYTEEQWTVRKQILKDAWNSKSEEEKEYHRKQAYDRWNRMSEEDYKAYSNKMIEIWANKLEEEKNAFSEKMRGIRTNLTEEERIEYGRKISEGRKNMSEEDKKRRADKCRQNYIDHPEKYKHIFDKMSEERKGVGNPAAKLVEYNGVVYNKMAFEKEFGSVDNFINDKHFKILYNNNPTRHEVLICPHCGKQSNSIGSISAFKRWHFDNCRKRGDTDEN